MDFFLLFSKCHSQWGEDWVGHRCFTVWVYLRNQFKKKKKENGGTLRKMCIWLHRQTVFTFYAFFPFGERGLCWTLNSDSARNPWALQSTFVFLNHFHMRAKERVWVCLFVHSFGLQRAINIYTRWIGMGWSSELCRALTESSFEMYIQCEGLKWFFLLNSIFYRFCRHFVVGRKKNKRNFMGACLPPFSVIHKHSFLQNNTFKTPFHYIIILIYKCG